MQQMFVAFQNSANFVLKYCSYSLIGHSARKINSLLQYIYIIFNLQWLMLNNLKQLRERHCTSLIQLIKQGALKKFFLLVCHKKQNEF